VTVKRDWVMEQSPKRGADLLSEEGLHPTYAVSSSSATQTTDEVDKKLRLDLERYRALCESERRFRITFEATPVGVSHIGLDGKLLLVNQGFCDLVGYTHEELYERTFVDITYAEDRIADIAYVERALAGDRQPYVREKRYIHKNGSLVWAHLISTLARDDAGDPLFFISVVM
jgi:PAS domain S-box-containing protein